MGAPKIDDNEDSRLLVQLTVADLKQLVIEQVRAAMGAAPEVERSTKWASVEEVARAYSVTGQTIKLYCSEGAPHRRMGNLYRIDLREFDAWLAKRGAAKK